MVNGKTKIYGVMGCPVEHSMSPMMHNYFSEQTGVDMAYVPFLVQPDQVGQAVEGAFALHIQGMNVTVPHKQAVLSHLVEIDDSAKGIGAVNTLVPMEGGYKGYNTDAEGLYRAMEAAGMSIEGNTCILIGAGGAAKAAAYVTGLHKAKKVYILNRSVDKAEALTQEMNRHFACERFVPLSINEWNQIAETGCIAIQTTSVGMHPDVDHSPIEDTAFFEKVAMAFDAIYTPTETKFMKLAKTSGAQVSNGLNMLLYQGVAAYELWNPNIKITQEMVAGARELLLAHLGGKV